MQAGDTIHRFRILSMLGRGGMAEVYLAAVEGPGGFEKRIALKLPLPHLAEDPEVTAMLIDEARVAAQLDHRNIAATLELGQAEGRHYIAMEYVRGISAARLIKHVRDSEERMPPHLSLFIASEIAAGLHYAHTATGNDSRPLNIVHRDVSPSNILLGVEGDVKLVDFGIAKAAYRTKHTVRQLLKGKLSYMAPEQANLEHVGPAADQFALGAVLYELLTGKRLYEGEHELELLDQARAAQTDAVAGDEALTADARPVLRRMLQRDPTARFESLEETREALRNALERVDPNGSEDTRRKELGSLIRTAARAVGADDAVVTPHAEASIPPTRPLDLAPIRTSSQLRRVGGSRWRAVGVAAAVLVGVALLYGVIERLERARVPAAADTGTVYVLPWEVEGSSRELAGLNTLAPGILGRRLVRVPEVSPVFWFRYREMRLAAPPLPHDGSVIQGEARIDDTRGVATATIRLVGPDERERARYDVELTADNALAELSRIGDRLVGDLGAAPSAIPEVDMPLGAVRIQQAGILALPAGNKISAMPAFEQMLKEYPTLETGYVWTGMMAWWQGPRRLGTLERLIQTARDNGLPAHVPAELEIMAGYVRDGHAVWKDRALALGEERPDDPFAQFLAGEANVHTDAVERGVEQLDRVRFLDPTILHAETHPFDFALIRGDAERLTRILQIRHSDPTDTADVLRMEFESRVALRQYDEAIAIGQTEYDAGRMPREVVTELALVLALQGQSDRAEHLLSEEEALGIDATRSVQASGMSAALIADRDDLYQSWVERASSARFTDPDSSLPIPEYRLMVQGRVIALLLGSDDPRWRNGMERLQPEVTPLPSQDRRALYMVRALEAWRAQDTEALDVVAADLKAEPIVRHFARGLAHETRGELTDARAELQRAMDARLSGRYTVLLAHALARVALAQHDTPAVNAACDEILTPRMLSIYLGPPVQDCRRWTQRG